MAIAIATSGTAHAQNYTSEYTKLNFDQHCTVLEEYELGVNAKCNGWRHLPIYFAEGDLRMMIRFGDVSAKTDQWESFSEFNNVGETVEWRLAGNSPVATILRWFVETTNDSTGNPERGQVLVISTIGTRANFGQSCWVGFVDARANTNANVLARNVADTFARNFRCGVDSPVFHGNRGSYSGNPNAYRR